MKNIISIVLAQIVVLADSTLFDTLREGLKRNPNPFLFFLYDVAPVLLIGFLFAISTVSQNKRRDWMILTAAEILFNGILLVLHFTGKLTLSSLIYPPLFIGFCAGKMIGSSKNKCEKKDL